MIAVLVYQMVLTIKVVFGDVLVLKHCAESHWDTLGYHIINESASWFIREWEIWPIS